MEVAFFCYFMQNKRLFCLHLQDYDYICMGKEQGYDYKNL